MILWQLVTTSFQGVIGTSENGRVKVTLHLRYLYWFKNSIIVEINTPTITQCLQHSKYLTFMDLIWTIQ
jgi:hypothetical protein